MNQTQTSTETSTHECNGHEPLVFHYCDKDALAANRDTKALCGETIKARNRVLGGQAGHHERILCPLCSFFYDMMGDDSRDDELTTWFLGFKQLDKNKGARHE